jgi:2-phosphosulfolactate phosphatase
LSPEAEVAVTCFDAVRDNIHDALHRCVGGVELDGIGFGQDVDVAAELDQSPSVPVLRAGIYSS